jgi:hypothetical protein
MMRYFIVAAVIGSLALSGCIFVKNADDVWQTSRVDNSLVGVWSKTNHFQALHFIPAGDHLLLSVRMDESTAVTYTTNLQVRTTHLLGRDMLIMRDIWGAWRAALSADGHATTNPLPAHLVHGYLLIPYQLRNDTLVLSTANSEQIERLIQSKRVGGFVRRPPPARDFTPPIIAELDAHTIVALEEQMEEGDLFGREQRYERSEQQNGH